jgi:hypothetical protein
VVEAAQLSKSFSLTAIGSPPITRLRLGARLLLGAIDLPKISEYQSLLGFALPSSSTEYFRATGFFGNVK